MKPRSLFLHVVMTLSVVEAVQAQDPEICQADPHFRDFDFWLGRWQVTARHSGKLAGTNLIRSVEGGCAIQENWTSQTGGTGLSLNWYDPAREKWRQVWVARPGYVIDIEGGLVDGSTVLEGHITDYGEKISHDFRGTWTPNADGTVRQFFEQFSATDETWKPWFDGLYTPLKKPADSQ